MRYRLARGIETKEIFFIQLIMPDSEIKKIMDKPCCFGKLDIVFPVGDDGLRYSPSECIKCVNKTNCLKEALSSQEGLSLREEKLNRNYFGGRIGFFERWAVRKEIHQKR